MTQLPGSRDIVETYVHLGSENRRPVASIVHTTTSNSRYVWTVPFFIVFSIFVRTVRPTFWMIELRDILLWWSNTIGAYMEPIVQ